MGEEAAHLLGSRVIGRDGAPIGRVIGADARELRVEMPESGVVRVPHGDLLRQNGPELVLRHARDWYADIAREPPAAPMAIEDGRLHDVSVDGAPPLEELQPGIEFGATPLRATTASDAGLRSSSAGDARHIGPPDFPELDIAARGLSIENSDRIEPGEPGTHRGGVMRGPPLSRGEAMNESSKHYLVGLVARGSDGQVVGRILSCDPESFTIERGHLVPRDTYVPYDQIVRVEEGVVLLREPADYYRTGGDMEDGEWTPEVARRSREIQGGHDRAARRTGELAPEEEDERAPAHGEAEPGVHVTMPSGERH